jgi:hypothetical protein
LHSLPHRDEVGECVLTEPASVLAKASDQVDRVSRRPTGPGWNGW